MTHLYAALWIVAVIALVAAGLLVYELIWRYRHHEARYQMFLETEDPDPIPGALLDEDDGLPLTHTRPNAPWSKP